jgi:hypothetical protein
MFDCDVIMEIASEHRRKQNGGSKMKKGLVLLSLLVLLIMVVGCSAFQKGPSDADATNAVWTLLGEAGQTSCITQNSIAIVQIGKSSTVSNNGLSITFWPVKYRVGTSHGAVAAELDVYKDSFGDWQPLLSVPPYNICY